MFRMRSGDHRPASATAFIAAVAFVLFASAPAPASANTYDNVRGWMWSSSIGWISMNCVDFGTCDTSNYGVTIIDNPLIPGISDMTGYAWAETVGWICFGSTCAGTTPEGGAPYAQYRDEYQGTTDQFHGWAKIVSMGDDGWISLNCRNMDECGTSDYHVSLDIGTGDFIGDPFSLSDNFAWGGNDAGTGAGWIDTTLVNTGWVPSRLGQIARPQGIYEPVDGVLGGTHLTDADIYFMNFSAPIGYQLRCDVKASDGSTRVLTKQMPVTVREGITDLRYQVQGSDPVGQRPWVLEGCRIATPYTSTACTSDADCGLNNFCDTTGGFCRTLTAVRQGRAPIFTHGNQWTGLDDAQDQYLTLKCYAGYSGEFLNNAAQCDFTGDTSFSLAMRRGIPLEGDCADGIDNDGNGQIDCADRYCQGISYLCQTLPRTLCTYGIVGDGVDDCTAADYSFGDLCCNRQPVTEGAGASQIVNGIECTAGDPNDGYYDCSCTDSAAFNASATDDCYAPGVQSGDLCCSADSQVIKY